MPCGGRHYHCGAQIIQSKYRKRHPERYRVDPAQYDPVMDGARRKEGPEMACRERTLITCQVSDGSGHQLPEDGEQHEPLVNCRTTPVEIRSDKENCKDRGVEQRKCSCGERIGSDPRSPLRSKPRRAIAIVV